MESIDNHLQTLLDEAKTPAVSYLLFNKDSVLHSFSSGFSDISNNEFVKDNTTFACFSVTKTFTALAILQLAEKGQLSLDDRVDKYVNEFPYSTPITILQLLTHTAGLPNPLPLKWVHPTEEDDSFSRDEFFKEIFIKHNKLKSAPNEKFAYSNLGYVILGQIIESVSGRSYEEYIHEQIIRPLGINKEKLDFRVNNKKAHAKGYQKKYSFMNLLLGFLMDKSRYVNRQEGQWISFKEMIINGAPHGGLIGTPHSFMRYIQELLNPDCLLLSEAYKRMLFTENKTNSNKNTGMCLSWFKGQINGHGYFTHAGGGAGYYCEIRIYPEQGLGSVIMFNRTGVKDERLLDKIDSYYLNK